MLEKIRKNLDPVSTEQPVFENLTPAAVLFPLLHRNGDLHILFTKRTQTVKAHKGQVAFPGGVRDPEDQNLLATALREAQEEIGLRPQDVQILGVLEPISTVTSGFLVHSFVAHIPYPYPFELNRREVSEILTVPFCFLADTKNWSLRTFHANERYFKAFFIHYNDYIIWGATARILKIFFERNGMDINIPPKMDS